MRIVLENARKLHEQYGATFQRPDPNEVAAGVFVKICQVNLQQGERFWVKVTAREGDKVTGTVANGLVFSPLQFGDLVTFELDNIYDIYTDEPGTGSEENNLRGVHKECNAQTS